MRRQDSTGNTMPNALPAIKRWTAHRKKDFLAMWEQTPGPTAREQILRKYMLTTQEIEHWQEQLYYLGVKGLRATKSNQSKFANVVFKDPVSIQEAIDE